MSAAWRACWGEFEDLFDGFLAFGVAPGVEEAAYGVNPQDVLQWQRDLGSHDNVQRNHKNCIFWPWP